jgi:hypothetical protein
MTGEPDQFNRGEFLVLFQNTLFNAPQVVDLIEKHITTSVEQVIGGHKNLYEHVEALCDEIIQKHDSQSRWGFNALLIKRKIAELRSQQEAQ